MTIIAIYVFLIDAGIAKALLTLEENKKGISSCTDEEYGFLTELLQSKELNSLFHVYNKILRHQKDDNFRPVLSNAMQINVEVLELLANRTHRDDVKELFQLLQKPHVQVKGNYTKLFFPLSSKSRKSLFNL